MAGNTNSSTSAAATAPTVNDQRVVMPVTLTDGARIRIADNILLFSEHDDETSGEHNAMTLVGSVADHSVIESRPVALLVCDIPRFSTMSETIPGAEMAQMLGACSRNGQSRRPERRAIDKSSGTRCWPTGGPPGVPRRIAGLRLPPRKMMLSLADTRKWKKRCALSRRDRPALWQGHVQQCGVAAERDATIIGDAVNHGVSAGRCVEGTGPARGHVRRFCRADAGTAAGSSATSATVRSKAKARPCVFTGWGSKRAFLRRA